MKDLLSRETRKDKEIMNITIGLFLMSKNNLDYEDIFKKLNQVSPIDKLAITNVMVNFNKSKENHLRMNLDNIDLNSYIHKEQMMEIMGVSEFSKDIYNIDVSYLPYMVSLQKELEKFIIIHGRKLGYTNTTKGKTKFPNPLLKDFKTEPSTYIRTNGMGKRKYPKPQSKNTDTMKPEHYIRTNGTGKSFLEDFMSIFK